MNVEYSFFFFNQHESLFLRYLNCLIPGAICRLHFLLMELSFYHSIGLFSARSWRKTTNDKRPTEFGTTEKTRWAQSTSTCSAKISRTKGRRTQKTHRRDATKRKWQKTAGKWQRYNFGKSDLCEKQTEFLFIFLIVWPKVEDRKKAIEDAERERREYILKKNQERDSRLDTKRRNERSSIAFAFGSSTPRLLDPVEVNLVAPSGSYWGNRRSTSITNVSYGGGGATQLSRRSSERELSDGTKKRATSAGGLNRPDGEIQCTFRWFFIVISYLNIVCLSFTYTHKTHTTHTNHSAMRCHQFWITDFPPFFDFHLE